MDYIVGNFLDLSQAQAVKGTDRQVMVSLRTPLILADPDMWIPKGRYFGRMYPDSHTLSIYLPHRFMWRDLNMQAALNVGIILVDDMEEINE